MKSHVWNVLCPLTLVLGTALAFVPAASAGTPCPTHETLTNPVDVEGRTATQTNRYYKLPLVWTDRFVAVLEALPGSGIHMLIRHSGYDGTTCQDVPGTHATNPLQFEAGARLDYWLVLHAPSLESYNFAYAIAPGVCHLSPPVCNP